MKRSFTTTISLLCLQLIPAIPPTANASELQSSEKLTLVSEAKTEIKTLAIALKSTLQHGMKTNGPAASVKLCNIQAPLITQASTAKSGSSDWTVSRTSLKLRNTENAPSAWVAEVLKGFDERKNKGEDPSSIAHSEIRDGQFYFIKAIPTQAACLACHGSNVGEDVKGKLAELYPSDQATSYDLGDIRGAFIARKPIND
jgi:hypothetical protein